MVDRNVPMFLLTCACVLASGLAVQSLHEEREHATLDHEIIQPNSEEIESILRMYQQYEHKHAKELQEANRLQADLFSASSPFDQSFLEMVPPSPPNPVPNPMNAKPMSPGPQWSTGSIPSREQFRFAQTHAGAGAGFVPTSGGSYPFGGRGFHYVPSPYHHPPAPPLAPQPPPPPPLYGAAGMQDLERLAVEQREAFNKFHGADPSDAPRFKDERKDDVDILTAAKTKLPPTHHAGKPTVSDMMREGSVLDQILADHKEPKAIPVEHQRTMMQHMDPKEKARFAALLKHDKATRPQGKEPQAQAQPRNTNNHVTGSKWAEDENQSPILVPRLLEVEAKESSDARQRDEHSLLRENTNRKTNRGKLRRRKFRGPDIK